MTPAEAASPSRPPLRDPTAPNFPGDDTLGIVSDKPERRLSGRIVNPSPASASQASVPAVPFVPSNEVLAPDDRASFSDRFSNWTSSPEGIAPRNPNLPVPPPAPSRPLGFFSGKPMPVWTVPPPLGGFLNNSASFGNGIGNWYEALTGGASSPAGGPNDTRSPPAPEPQESQGPLSLNEAYLLYLARRNGNKPQASMFDPAAPTAPFDAAAPNPLSGGLPGRFAALAGLDPQNPDQPAPSPTDDEQEQANLRALDARLSATGDLRDAVALYMARKASRR